MTQIARIAIAVLVAVLSVALLLQHAAAEPGSPPPSGSGPHRIYLSMIATASAKAGRSGTGTPNAAISVTARASLTCDEGETVPVTGARITVITAHSSYVALTGATGNVVFTATAEPAVIQIEWPAGLLPCPNSRPVVELPGGTGAVEFIAVAGP